MKRRGLFLTAAVAALSSLFGGAQAQETTPAPRATGFDDVVVTARRQQEKLQSVPVSVSVVAPEKIGQQGAFSPYQLQQTVPGVHVVLTSSAVDTLIINIRGQTQAPRTLFPPVITYYNETPMLRGLSAGQFFDLENIQILRGPQGVRFGRVTNGGAFLISPKKPHEDFGGYIQAKVGDYSLHGLEGALNVPIVADKLLLRAAFDSTRRDGYTHNLLTGRDLDDVNYDTQRLSLVFRPFQGFENYTSAQYQHTKQNGNAQAPVWLTPTSTVDAFFPIFSTLLAEQNARGPRVVDQGRLLYGPDGGIGLNMQSFVLSNVTTYELNENISFKNVFGYITHNQRQAIDDDGTTLPIIDLAMRFRPTSQSRNITEEFQINGKFFDNRLTTTLGIFVDELKPTREISQDIIIFGATEQAGVAQTKVTSKAVYASFEYDLRDFVEGLKINGGMRYTKDKTDANTVQYAVPVALTNQVPFGKCTTFLTFTCQHTVREDSATTWEAGATYQATKNLFLYASGRRGYRGGGVTLAISPENREYRPEFDTEIEIGAKADWTIAGMQARTNVALFRDKLKNIQKSVTFVAGSPPISQSYTTNAADATIQGVEFEGRLVPMDGLNLRLIYAWTDARYDKLDPSLNPVIFNPVNGICNFNARSPQPAGTPGFCPYNTISGTPKHQATLSADYQLPLADALGEISFGGDWSFMTKQAFNDVNYAHPSHFQKSYSVINLHASWKNIFEHPVDLGFFVTNVTDKVYRVGSVDLSKLSNVGYNIVSYGEPRMYGATLKYRFGGE